MADDDRTLRGTIGQSGSRPEPAQRIEIPVPGYKPKEQRERLEIPLPSYRMPDPDFIPLPSEKKAAEFDFIPLNAPADRRALANTANDSLISAALKAAGTTTIKGLSTIGGLPGDMHDMVGYLMARAQHPFSHEEAVAQQTMAKERAKARGMVTMFPTSADVAAPVLERTGEYVPQSEMGRYAMIGGEGAISMLGPGGLARGLRAAGRGVEGAADLAREVLKGGVYATPGGAGANVAGTAATEYSGDPLLGVVAGAAVPPAAGKPATSVGAYMAPLAAHYAPGWRQTMADKMLKDAAKDPAAAARAAQAAEIIPGSRPNLAEVTGDPGLLQAQKAAETADGAFKGAIDNQQAAQNAARIAELQKLAPAGADVMAPSKLFQDRLAKIDAETDAWLSQEISNAQAARIPDTASPEALGTALRDVVQGHADKARAARSALYRAIDPDGNLTVATGGARDTAKNLAASVDPAVTIESAHAKPVIGMVAGLGELTPFSKLMDLDATITAQMRAAKRAEDAVGHGQLVQLKKAVANDIETGLDRLNDRQSQMVARGEMAPENTIAAQLRRLDQRADEFLAQDAGRSTVARVAENSGSQATGVPGSVGGPGENRFGSAIPEGAEGVPGDVPKFDPEAPARVAAAKQAHADYAQTYKQGPVASALKTEGFSGQYRMPAPAVPAAAFPPGDRGYSTTAAWLKAANNDPAAVSALQDAAVMRLRAEMKNGTLSPSTLNAWRTKYSNALRAIDEVSPGFSTRFDDAARATDAVGSVQRARETALADQHKGVAGRYLGATDPSEVVKLTGQILSAADGPSQLRELLGTGAGLNSEAVQGLRRAGVEYMLNRFSNAGVTTAGDPVLSGAGLRGFLANNEGSLKGLYGVDGVANMRRVADDMARSQQAYDAMRVKGGSDTANKAIQWLKENATNAPSNLITISMALSTLQQALHGDLWGAAAALTGTSGKMWADSLRRAGVEDVRQLYLKGLLEPDVGAAMLQRAIDRNGAVNLSAMRRFTDAVAESAARSVYLQAPEEKRQQRASGGRVTDHAAAAGRLIKAAEAAGRLREEETSPLLGAPDALVAHALEVAGRGI